MVLISFRDYSRLKANSEKYLDSIKKTTVSDNDNCKGHGAVELEEASQLPNKEIPKQDIYQEKYANAVLEGTATASPGPSQKSVVKTSGSTTSGHIAESDYCDKYWYYIGIPKCMEKT